MNNITLYAAAVLIWGSTWFIINFQLGVVAPAVSIAYRFAIAAVVLFGWCLFTRRNLRFGWRAHGIFFQLGLLMFSLNYLAGYVAQGYINSALNAVGFTSVVWLNILNARLFFGTPLEARVLLGAGLGMVGIVVLFWPGLTELDWSGGVALGASLSLTGALLASLGNIASQHGQARGLPVTASNAWGMAYGTLVTFMIALATGQPFDFDPRAPYVLSLIYLSLVGSVVAFGCYLTLLGRVGAHRAGYVVVMFPVVAVIISVLFEGLAIDRYVVSGVALVLTGNTLIIGRGGRRRTGGT